MMKWIGLSGVLLGLAACDGRGAADWSDWPQESALGVRYAVPPGMAAGVRGVDITMTTPTDRRIIDTITLYTERNGLVPEIARADLIIIEKGKSPAPYVLAERGAGSGGTEYGLFTSKTVGSRTVGIFANRQTEDGPPSFAEAWAVWESLEPSGGE